jgi:formylglycine-generating enzyme required for sulfatase activity
MKHAYGFTATVVAVTVLLGVPGCDNRDKVIDGIEFVWCPAGTFQMGRAPGDPNGFFSEDPQHPVTFSRGFWISKHEVTEEQWLAVMGGGLPHYNGCHPARLDKRPVEQVSWNDTQSFLAAINTLRPGMNFRLPSEAEWEYACRAGTTTPYIWGSDPSDTELDKYAWHDGNSGGDTHDVGTRQPNAWGIYDMYGNVWEWVQDSEHQSYNGAPADGSAWEDAAAINRVARGGSFYNGDGCRSAFRAIMAATGIWGDYGFRIVKVPDDTQR